VLGCGSLPATAPKPTHSIPGIVDTGIDINRFDGDAVKLAAEWSGPITVEPTTA
jgi:hypothetical protein